MRPSMSRMGWGRIARAMSWLVTQNTKKTVPVSVSRRGCREGELGVYRRFYKIIGKEIG